MSANDNTLQPKPARKNAEQTNLGNLSRNNASTSSPGIKTHVGKATAATMKPVKTMRFSGRTCKRYLRAIRFCDFRTHLHPRSFIARFPPVRVKGFRRK